MELLVASQKFFLGMLVVSALLPSHQMGHYLFLGVVMVLSRSGMYRLVGLLKLSLAIIDLLSLSLSQQIIP